MDERMIGAAQTGDINILYELILNDPYVLQRIDDVPFFHTPLHVAASAGHFDFMMEMINLKPSFARKLNQAGFSPMHLALQNQKTQAVLRLLRFDEGLLRVKRREGFTPLHHVVQNGNVDFLIKFLEVCPEAIEDVTVRDETVFHLAVKNNRFEAFQVLVGWLIRSRHKAANRWEKELLSWADIDGNTVLHVAAIRNRPQVVKVLLEHLCGDHINAKNAKGLTALDIQSQYPYSM
ncbi:ankyrin repeat-containing protein BDA1-like [Gossypium arboreum]|uniref:ankyrin repeat-containing protein BDA1-like n=1 Tax=Gossypium arboreum TaxID=29729 RepID=UPI0022F1D83D|nr:ankyrin repeat-containing protein BDA1-like [Gossypium arboreum]